MAKSISKILSDAYAANENAQRENTIIEWAMEQYARQEAIAMAQWATLNDYTYLKSKGYWVNEEREELNETFTDEQPYTLYLTTK